MNRDLINIVVNRLRIAIVILCIVPVLILAGITFGDWKMMGAVPNIVEASSGLIKENIIFTISAKNGLALSVKNWKINDNKVYFEKLNPTDVSQHFTYKPNSKNPNIGDFYFNNSGLRISNGELRQGPFYNTDHEKEEEFYIKPGFFKDSYQILRNNYNVLGMNYEGSYMDSGNEIDEEKENINQNIILTEVKNVKVNIIESVVDSKSVFIIHNKEGMALSASDFRTGESPKISLKKLDPSNINQHFTFRPLPFSKDKGKIFVNGTSKLLSFHRIEEYVSELVVGDELNSSWDNTIQNDSNLSFILNPNNESFKLNLLRISGDKILNDDDNYHHPIDKNDPNYLFKISKINVQSVVPLIDRATPIIPNEKPFRISDKSGNSLSGISVNNEINVVLEKTNVNNLNQLFYWKNNPDRINNGSLYHSQSKKLILYDYDKYNNQVGLGSGLESKFDGLYNGYENIFKIIPGFFANSIIIKLQLGQEMAIDSVNFNSTINSRQVLMQNFDSAIPSQNFELDYPRAHQDKVDCSSSTKGPNRCLILTDQIFSISQDNSNLGLKAADYAKKSNISLTAADKNEFDPEQVFKYKSQSFNQGYFYINGTKKVLSSINGEIKIVNYTGAVNQRIEVSEGPIKGTLQFKDFKGKVLNINSSKIVKSDLELSATDPSQVFRINSIFDTSNKTKCEPADNCIFKDKQLFTLSTKGTNNSLSSLDYATKKSDPNLIANAKLLGAPSNETEEQQQFEWREYGKDRGYIVLKGSNIALVAAKDPKSNKTTIMFREYSANQEIQIFNVIRGSDPNSIQIFDKNLQAISLNGTSVITAALVKNTSTQTFTIGDIIDTSLPCPATPTQLGCLIAKDKVFALTTSTNNAIKIDKGTTPITAKYDSSDPLQALKWSELSFNKGNLKILGTNNALASIGGKLITKPFDKTSKEQIFTVIKGSTPDALIFVDGNGLAINIDQTTLSMVALSRGSISQNLTVKDSTNALIKNNQTFTISNLNGLAIQVLKSDAIALGEISPAGQLADMKVNIKYHNQANPEQRFKWITSGLGKGYIFFDGYNKVLKQDGSIIKIVDFKSQKDAEFTVNLGELPDTVLLSDSTGKLLTLNNNPNQDATFKLIKGVPVFATKLNDKSQSLKLNTPTANYFDIEDPIPIPVKYADTTRRIEGKNSLDFTNSKNVFLRFINDEDRKSYATKNYLEKDIYIVSHGFKDTSIFNDGNYKNQFPNHGVTLDNDWVKIAEMIKENNASAIVLVLDWSNLAAGQNPGLGTNGDLLRASTFINNVAVELKNKLNIWGTKNGSTVNVYGHSLGTYMANEIGREFGKINSMVALDPASDWADVSPLSFLLGKNSMPVKWNDNFLSPFRADKYVDDFKQFSNYSVSFTGRRSIAGNEGLNQTANEAFWMSYDDKDLPIADIHTWVNNSFIAINTKSKLYLSTVVNKAGKIVTEKQEVLTFPTYNLASKNVRNYQRDNTPTNYQGFCTTSTKLIDCTKSRYVPACVANKIINGLNCFIPQNDWTIQSWENHNGLVVAKKPSIDDKSKKITDSRIEYGYIKFNSRKNRVDK